MFQTASKTVAIPTTMALRTAPITVSALIAQGALSSSHPQAAVAEAACTNVTTDDTCHTACLSGSKRPRQKVRENTAVTSRKNQRGERKVGGFFAVGPLARMPGGPVIESIMLSIISGFEILHQCPVEHWDSLLS